MSGFCIKKNSPKNEAIIPSAGATLAMFINNDSREALADNKATPNKAAIGSKIIRSELFSIIVCCLIIEQCKVKWNS
jgi:hypothetical protein